ncbi:MAG: oxidase [Bacteroidota bacterium]
MIDILINDGFDLEIENGDFLIGQSTRQHQALLLLTEKGEWREFPLRGVGAVRWINDDLSGDLNGAIKREYEADGMVVNGVKGNIENLQIEAYYESNRQS